MSDFVIIGLTGPTGAGKTTIANVFEEYGAAIINCDKLAREAVNEKDCIENLCRSYGDDIVSGGVLDRALLAKRAFVSEEKTNLLNSITHPVILRLLSEDIKEKKATHKAVVIDAPLLFEASLEKICDKVVSVIAPYDVRIDRIIKRDNLSHEAAVLRMSRQKNDEFYTERSDYVIDGTISDVTEAVKTVLKDLQVII